ncbi:hypothetical protein D3C75_1151240 [compost metagenome]
MHAVKISSLPPSRLVFSARGQFAYGFNQLRFEFLGSPVGNEEFQTGMVAFLPVAVIPEQGNHPGSYLKRFFRLHEDIQLLRQMRFGRESAAHHQMEPLG